MTMCANVMTNIDAALLVVKNQILERIGHEDSEIIDAISEYIAFELLGKSEEVTLHTNKKAISCEICNSGIIMKEHTGIEKALEYALDNIADIFIIYKNKLIEYSCDNNGNVHWNFVENYELEEASIAS